MNTKHILFTFIFLFGFALNLNNAYNGEAPTDLGGGWWEIKFLENGSWIPPQNIKTDTLTILVVGGGGGAGRGTTTTSQNAGGGGAGGLVYVENYTIDNEIYSIQVGSGGAGSSSYSARGNTGENSIFDILVGYGGGGGGSPLNSGGTPESDREGGAGGSGGGAGVYGTSYADGGATTQNIDFNPYLNVGFGNEGGTSSLSGKARGGGGAGGESIGQAGGVGKTYWGITYATGGSAQSDGASGSANTGNGGNARATNSDANGGAGGSGIVIIQYYLIPFNTIDIISPKVLNYTTNNILINLTNTSAYDKMWYNWNGTNVTYTTPILTSFTAGVKTLNVWANSSTGDIENKQISFNVYTTPTPASFTHDYQINKPTNNITLNWSSANDEAWPLINYTLFIFNNVNINPINNYSLSNSTLSYNYNNSVGIYYPIIESCNQFLCSNSTTGKTFSFQSISFIDWPVLVTSLENYIIKVNATNEGSLLKNVSIYKDTDMFNTTFINPYYKTDFNTTLYENDTYNFTAIGSYELNNVTYNLTTSQLLTIHNLSVTNCTTAGHLNYIPALEDDTPQNASIGILFKLKQPLGDIDFNFSSSNTNTLKVCISPQKEYYIDNDIFYTINSIGRSEEYYLRNALYNYSLNNTLYLYSVNYSEILNVVILDEYSQIKPNAVVSLVKYYPDEMISKTISTQRTNTEGVVNFFYSSDDLVKLVVADLDNNVLKEDDEFSKYYSTTGYYSRTIKLSSLYIPDVSAVNYSCSNYYGNNFTTTTCDFACNDFKQRNYTLILYDINFGNTSTEQIQGVYTCSGTLALNSTSLNSWYEFKIDGVTYLNGLGEYNPSALPLEIRFFVYPLLLLVFILGAINPVFAIGGLLLLGMFSQVGGDNFLFFNENFMAIAVVLIVVLLVFEIVKPKK